MNTIGKDNGVDGPKPPLTFVDKWIIASAGRRGNHQPAARCIGSTTQRKRSTSWCGTSTAVRCSRLQVQLADRIPQVQRGTRRTLLHVLEAMLRLGHRSSRSSPRSCGSTWRRSPARRAKRSRCSLSGRRRRESRCRRDRAGRRAEADRRGDPLAALDDAASSGAEGGPAGRGRFRRRRFRPLRDGVVEALGLPACRRASPRPTRPCRSSTRCG